jgi:hypothetical protein
VEGRKRMSTERLPRPRLLPPRDPAPPPEHPIGLGEDSGPHPVVRAAVGLLLGLAAGAVASALTPPADNPRRGTAADDGPGNATG